ncbi:MAG: helix-turn-helix domain-containing protein [Clostridia bacterium]|nr:helix-turn-helix domain-containing protein [Clostridia bacterium]
MNSYSIDAGGIFAERVRYNGDVEDVNLLRCHDGYEMLYVVDGSARCIVEGLEYLIKPRSLVIFPPLAYHSISIAEGESFERILVRFSDNSLLDIADGLVSGIVGERVGIMYLAPAAISESIISVMERFSALRTYPSDDAAKFARLYASELVLLISMVAKRRENGDESDLGVRVMKYLNENIEADISLDMLAKKFFVSKYYLCRAFKQQNGISVHGYVTRKRILRARQLIEAGETAARAADRVGFGDYSAFYRAYVKFIGKSPTYEKYKR